MRKLRQENETKPNSLSKLQPVGEWQELISPNQGHLRVNGLYLSFLPRELVWEIEKRDPINVICASQTQGQMKSGEQIKTPLKARPKIKVKRRRGTKSIPQTAPSLVCSMLTYQHIKNAPGKLTNILLKPSAKILTHRRKIKSPQDKDALQARYRACPCPSLGMNL